MGNITFANDKSYNSDIYPNDRENHHNNNNFNKYNNTQTGNHSVNIIEKLKKKKVYSDREKEYIGINKKDLKTFCKSQLNDNIFKLIFPPPEKDSNFLRRSCRETSKLTLREEENKNKIKINYSNMSKKRIVGLDSEKRILQISNSDQNRITNYKEMNYEINEDYFSLIKNKIEEANEQILDFRRFSRRSFELEKIGIYNKKLNSKLSFNELIINENSSLNNKINTNKGKDLTNFLESNSISQAGTKPNTIDDETVSLKNLKENSNQDMYNKKPEISIKYSSKSNKIDINEIKNIEKANEDPLSYKKKCLSSSYIKFSNKKFPKLTSSNENINFNKTFQDIQYPILIRNDGYDFECENLNASNEFDSFLNSKQNIEFELNNVRTSEELRRSYMAKLIYKNIWQPTKKQKDHNSLIIFDWDDTLLPTSFLTPNGIFSEHLCLDKNEKEKLHTLDNLAYKILSQTIKKADTYIITNAEPGWVEYSAGRFYPKVHSLLNKIKLVSARGEFEKKLPNDSRQWKIQTFLKMVDDFDTNLITNFICLGDSIIEMEAAHIFASKFSQAYIKTIKFKESPSLDELIKQLTLVTDQFLMIFSAIKNLTIRVERKSKNRGS